MAIVTSIVHGIIVTRHLGSAANLQVPPHNLNTGIKQFLDTGGSNQTVSSTSYVDINGMSTTRATGAGQEKVLIIIRMMGNSAGTSNAFLAINANGSIVASDFVPLAVNWTQAVVVGVATLPANTTVTIKAQSKILSGTSAVWNRDASDIGFLGKINIVPLH